MPRPILMQMSTHVSSSPIDRSTCWQAVQAAAQPANPCPPDLRRHPTDDEWFTDDDGKTCDTYTTYVARCSSAWMYDDDDFQAEDMCCACGGGGLQPADGATCEAIP